MSAIRLPSKFVVAMLAAIVFLVSFSSIYRNEAPQQFATKVSTYTGIGEGRLPWAGEKSKAEGPAVGENGGLGRIYTNKEEWLALKEQVAKGELLDKNAKPTEDQLKYDDKVLKLDIPWMHLPTFDVPAAPLTTAPKPHQIAILTATDGGGHNGGVPHIVEQAIANRGAYARLHGYVHQFINISDYDVSGAHAVWKKIPAIIDCFRKNPDVQWVWWLDLDAIIMSSHVDLSEYLLSPEALDRVLEKDKEYIRGFRKIGLKTPSKYDLPNLDLLVSSDHNGLNAGSFFLRRSAFTQMLLRLMVDPVYIQQDWVNKEQDVLTHLIIAHDFIRSHVGWVKQKYINGYAFSGDDGFQWIPGNLVVHLAGCWVDGATACKERWEEYMAKADDAVRVDSMGKPVMSSTRAMRET